MSGCALALPDLAYESGRVPPWTPIAIGSETHKMLFCCTLLDTFNAYRPSIAGASRIGVDIDLADLLDLCLVENDRRLGLYDSRLLRPLIVPTLVRLARRFLRRTGRTLRS